MRNNLTPFVPNDVTYTILPLTKVKLEPGYETQLGFKKNSNQDRFLRTPMANSFVVIVMPRGVYTNSLTSRHVVATAFGTVNHGILELTHIGVNKQHPFNISDAGKRWGAHGIVKDASGTKVRWRSDDPNATKLTAKNHTRFVHGTPNPYVVFAIYKFATSTKFHAIHTVKQNPGMPCAKLFHKDYDHSTHPAIQLIYESLDFKKPLDHYQWNSSNCHSLVTSYTTLLERMRVGLRML